MGWGRTSWNRRPAPPLPETWRAMYDAQDALYAKYLPKPMWRLVNLVPLLTVEERAALAAAMRAARHTWPGLTDSEVQP